MSALACFGYLSCVRLKNDQHPSLLVVWSSPEIFVLVINYVRNPLRLVINHSELQDLVINHVMPWVVFLLLLVCLRLGFSVSMVMICVSGALVCSSLFRLALFVLGSVWVFFLCLLFAPLCVVLFWIKLRPCSLVAKSTTRWLLWFFLHLGCFVYAFLAYFCFLYGFVHLSQENVHTNSKQCFPSELMYEPCTQFNYNRIFRIVFFFGTTRIELCNFPS